MSTAPTAQTAPLPDDARCVAHPSRPAVDRCPRCGRARCGADAREAACPVCRAEEAARARRTVPSSEAAVRAALGASALAFPAGWVLAEYVGSPVFQYLAPVVVGVACAAAATAAAGDPPRLVRTVTRAAAVLYAVLGTALGFVLDGTYAVLSAHPDVLVPYVAAAGGAWLWSAPPRARKRGT